jgi:NACHT domain- and WD repeat-containing protein
LAQEEQRYMAGGSRIVRIFVSSTFSDLKAERDALQREVFPRLRALCSGRGARFQAVDLRWGVYEEAGLDQQTMDICLGELRRCQVASPRPNFMVLLGDRYGWRPLPARIPAHEYELLRTHARSDDVQRLDAWYRLDQNATPPDYCLQPRTGEAASYVVWSGIEAALRGALLAALAQLPPAAIADLARYQASATEQEILAGALDLPDAGAHVHCFFRSISGLPDDVSAAAYLDLDASGHADADSSAALADLKDRLRHHLPGNIHDYTANWTGTGVTTDHIAQLCADVYETLARLIAEALDAEERLPDVDREAEEHARFGRERARHFQGREPSLRDIGDYITGAQSFPLVVYGASGVGKSALMAFVAERASALVPAGAVVARYIGATAASADPRALLDGLCRQITRRYGGDEGAIPTDLEGLARAFPQRLALATANEPLVVALDALDQLVSATGEVNLSWLPTELPPHARIIVSCAGDDPPATLRARLPAEAFQRLDPLTRDDGSAVLDSWLTDAQRTLQPDQREVVLTRFAEDGLPLYLRFAFEEARRWRSYTPPTETTLRPGIAGIIGQLFDRLSSPANHGPMLVARSLGYLGAARNGLSEDEMLDVLSADADTLADFRARSPNSPRTDRLPIVVWSRLYFDLEPYLTERAADGAPLFAFYHRQLANAVTATYLAGADDLARHRALASYFAALAPGGDDGAATAPRLRRLAELPYQQTMGELWDDLFATLTDFHFLEEKAAALAVTTRAVADGATATTYGGVYLLQDDFALALQRMPTQ